jgi:hypothetical protein
MEKLDADTNLPQASLRIEIGAKVAPTLDAYADAIAQKGGFTKSATAAKIGGIRAIELDHSVEAGDPDKMSSVIGWVLEQSGYYYGLYYFATPELANDGASWLPKSVRWSAPIAPEDALLPRDPVYRVPVPLGDTGLAFTLPDPFRASKLSPQGGRFTTYNFAAKTIGAAIDFAVSPPGVPDLSTAEKTYTANSARLGCVGQLEWTSPAPSVALSKTMARNPDQNGAPLGPLQIMLVFTRDRKCIVVNFEYPDEKSAAKYARATEEIARSVRRIQE